MAKIFINYRRVDSDDDAEILFYALQSKLKESYKDSDILFKDTQKIPPGSNWAQVIQENLASVGIVLVIIGKNWLQNIKYHSNNEASKEIDWVVEEISIAIEKKKIIIPILFDGASFPNTEELPLPIKDLLNYQASKINIRDDNHRDDDLNKLVHRIKFELTKLPHLPLPDDISLPKIPYKELVPFTREDARIFFGRSEAIMELFDRIQSNKERLTLYFGQSGVGKSSVLMAGLLPRVERAWGIKPAIIRRNKEIGLNDQLRVFRNYIEKGTKMLLVIDQTEEIFTDKNLEKPNEIDLFFKELKEIFNDFPMLKIILGFRKEWLADIEKLLEGANLKFREQYRKVYLTSLIYEEVIEAIEGASKLDYGLSIDKGLSRQIAEKIIQDKDSHIAPLLQLLLRKMWDFAFRIDEDNPKFTYDLYKQISSHNLETMVDRAFQELDSIYQAFITNGLVLSLLKFYTTEKGTATEQSDRKLLDLYSHIPEILQLKNALKNSYLLTEPAGKKETFTRLAHDTLAPIIQEKYRNSAFIGQQAERLLESKKLQILNESYEGLFTTKDLETLETGIKSMRKWNKKEEEAYSWNKSKIAEAKQNLQEKIKLSIQALSNTLVNASKLAFNEKNYSKSIRLAELANEIFPENKSAFDVCIRSFMSLGFKQEIQGHSDTISYVDWSSDGQRIVTASYDQTVKIWDRTGKLLNTLKHPGFLRTAIFSPNGNYLVTTSKDEEPILWNKNGGFICKLIAHTKSVSLARFSPDGKNILTASYDQTAIIWDLEGNPLHTLKGHTNGIEYANYSPDGTLILTLGKLAKIWTSNGRLKATLEIYYAGGFVGALSTGIAGFSPYKNFVVSRSHTTIQIWDYKGRLKKKIEAHTQIIKDISYSPDGRSFITASEDKVAKLWNFKGELLHTFKGHTESVECVIYSPNGEFILTGSKDKTARLWDTKGNLVRILEGHTNEISKAKFSPDSKEVITLGGENEIKIWDTTYTPPNTIIGHSEEVYQAQYSPNGKYILTTSKDNTAKLWNEEGGFILSFDIIEELGIWGVENTIARFAKSGEYLLLASEINIVNLYNLKGDLVQTFEGHSEPVLFVDFSPNEQLILTASNDNTARLWEINGRLLQSFDIQYYSNRSIQFSPSGEQILACAKNNIVKLWDLRGSLIQDFEGHSEAVTSISFSPKGNYILTGSKDNTIKQWDLKGNITLNLEGFGELDEEDKLRRKWVSNVVYSPNGNYIIAILSNRTTKIWDHRGNFIQRLEGYKFEKFSFFQHKVFINFSPDGNSMITALGEKTIEIWNKYGDLVHILEGHKDEVNFAQFSPDGKRIISASKDNTVKIWDLGFKELSAKINEIGISSLSLEELNENEVDNLEQAAGINRVEQLLNEEPSFKTYMYAKYYQDIARRNPSIRRKYLDKANQLLDFIEAKN